MTRRNVIKRGTALLLALCMVVSLFGGDAPQASAQETDDFLASMNDKFEESSLSTADRPQMRWWLDQSYHTDETLIETVEILYQQGYGGVELLCLNNSQVDNSLYGWGTEEWYHDMLVVVEECGKRGMTVSFAAGPDWQPTFLYYGTNEDVAAAESWEDYQDSYEILTENGRDVLQAAYEADGYNVYETSDGTLALDPNVDAFLQGIGLGYTDENGDTETVAYVEAGETITIDLTNYTYVSSSGGGGGGSWPFSAELEEDVDEADEEVSLKGTQVNRTKYDLDFQNFETITLTKADAVDSTDLSLDGVTQFTEAQLTVGTDDSLITYDEAAGTYTFQWTAPNDGEVYALTPSWRVGVGHGTEADTYDYGYMLMMNHFNTAGADAAFAFWKTYMFTDEMVDLFEEYDMEIDFFIDSLEIGSLGNYYWSDEMRDIFCDLNGYDVTPYLTVLNNTSYTITDDDYDFSRVQEDMYNAMNEAYIIFQQRLSDNLATVGCKLRAQVSYGKTGLNTSSAIRAVDVPETESLAFKNSVEAFKLMSGGVHLSGAEEFSSETNNWLGVDYASVLDQAYIVHMQMAAGVNRVVWHGLETEFSSSNTASWPNNTAGIGSFFASRNIPTYDLEREYNYHITLLQTVLKQGTETVDVGVMQNGWYSIVLPEDGDTKGLLTSDHTLQNKGYTWECFDSSYLWVEDGVYGFQNDDGTLGNPQYQAIVVYDEDLSLSAARALLELVEGGLVVVFNGDDAATTTGTTESDAALKDIVDEIKTHTDKVAVADTTEDIVDHLETLGVRPRMEMEQAVADDYAQRMYEESLKEEQEAHITYEGIWTAMMRDDDVNYYYVWNESLDYTMTTTVSFEGEGVPYVMDTWSGEITPVAEYTVADGRTEITISVEPTDTQVYILRKTSPADDTHVASTDAEWAAIDEAQTITVQSSESGNYSTTLSNGETVTSEITVPEINWDESWSVEIESWTEGDYLARSEVRKNVDPYTGSAFTVNNSIYHTTTEYGYDTNKEVVFDGVISNEELVPWKDMYDAGLSDIDLTAVSGLGAYETSFTLPSSWDVDRDGIILTMEVDGMIGVTVNDETFLVNCDVTRVDISSALKPGETNTISVLVTTTLTNVITAGRSGTQRAMQENPTWPMLYKDYPEDYGLAEPVGLTAYSSAVVYEGEGEDPGTEPTDPGTEPTDPGTEPTDPGTEPTDPGTEPTDPGTEPTDPGTEPTDPGTSYTVTVGSNEGGTVTGGSFAEGTDAEITIQADEGYRLATILVDGVAVDISGVEDVFVLTNIRAEQHVQVLFIPEGEDFAAVFDDVSKTTDSGEATWYYEAVDILTGLGIITGQDETTFAPDANIKRSEFAKLIYELADIIGLEPELADSVPFTDRDDYDTYWATGYIGWAYEEKIITGYDDEATRFGPEDFITRQDMATMIWRLLVEYAGYDLPGDTEIDFADADEISDYAEEAADFVVRTGLMQGYSADTFGPQDNTERSQVAQVLYNYLFY